ncbi:aldose epimerase family protein [Robertkochia aurantiaca]|uniref:aldose epimerase family protein n=1 Tax=Robertkochia aurantiaca TaxID=2873700 RepID=UPI001CCB1478|nr:aldose epimerase family protein [Robertkochia sp. 3YJGBD-33]
MNTIYLENEQLAIETLDYGATLTRLWVPDSDGKRVNVVIGMKYPEGYRRNIYYTGATCGRVAGRLDAKGFNLNNERFTFDTKASAVLHGGKEGFSFKTWEIIDRSKTRVTYALISEHMDEGFPGRLETTVTYELQGSDLVITYEAQTDRPTLVNLTNHSYFNLNGGGSILDHELQLHASHFLEKDKSMLATGELVPVADTPFDFSKNRVIRTKEDFNGIDDFLLLVPDRQAAAVLKSQRTGIRMEVHTDQPGIVIFTPQNMQGYDFENPNLANMPAICFETQVHPNAPAYDHFPDISLQPGQVYRQATRFRFSH